MFCKTGRSSNVCPVLLQTAHGLDVSNAVAGEEMTLTYLSAIWSKALPDSSGIVTHIADLWH